MTPLIALPVTAGALGIWLVVQSVPSPMPPPLRDRVVPYLRRPEPVWRSSGTWTASSLPRWLPSWLSRLAKETAARVAWISGGEGSVRRRLDALGAPGGIDQFRLEQLGCGVAGAVLVMAVVVLRGVEASNLVPSLIGVGLGALGGILYRDRRLTVVVQRRQERLRTELPTIVEMLAMAVASGASLMASLERVGRIGHGVVAGELSRVVDDTRVGLPLVPALQRMAMRNDVVEVHRFVDAIVVATERGTPLADVLTAQAADAREAGRRALIEVGGRKEIGMMVPVVFLVLPLSVLFVLFPGFYGLSLGT